MATEAEIAELKLAAGGITTLQTALGPKAYENDGLRTVEHSPLELYKLQKLLQRPNLRQAKGILSNARCRIIHRSDGGCP